LKWQRAITDDLQLSARAYYDKFDYRADFPFDFGPPMGGFLTHSDSHTDSVGAEVQMTKKILDRHTLVAGAEGREDMRLYEANYFGRPRQYNFRSDHDRSTAGVYGQAEIVLLTNLLLNAGVRYDYYSSFGNSVNPRLGLIYSPWTAGTFKLLYGSAYRAPNAHELYIDAPGIIEGNPDLNPETIRTYELAYEHQFPANVRASLSAYHYEIDDLIEQQLDPLTGAGVFRNLAAATGTGMEAGVEWRYAHGGLIRVSYALQRTEDTRTKEELTNSPRQMAKLNAIAPLYHDKLFAGLEVQYLSGMKTFAGNRTDGFAAVNLTLFSQKIIKNLELSATVYNLFDTRYSYPVSTEHLQDSIEQDGRGFRIKATYKF
jgi:outer membrane receptor for ferrienterochelin and colicins